MSQIFIELWKLKPAWRDLGQDGRAAYVDGLLPAVQAMVEAGVEVVAWGFNEADVDQRADFDVFAVYRTPSKELARQLQSSIRASGWYDYFDQVNAGGAALPPPDVLNTHVALAAPLS